MRTKMRAVSYILAVVLVVSISFNTNTVGSEEVKISEKLQETLEKVGDTDLIPVYVVLAQIETGQLEEELVQHLKTETEKAQGPLLNYLARYTSAGYEERGLSPDSMKLVEEIHSLWIGNVISFKATKQMILDMSEMADVLRINLNEPRYDLACYNPEAWGVSQIEAPSVWNLNATGQGVVVAVLDTGVDWTHPDLSDHIWTNPGEDPWANPDDPTTGNGVDDDGNGFVDDWRGWNFVDNSNDPMPQPIQLGWQHGTHVAGTVAGDGTNGTTTGVAPEAHIMIVRTIEGGTEADNWAGIQYAVENGADVINMSLGWLQIWGPDNLTWRTVCVNAINSGLVMVIAAGNEDNFFGPPYNLRTPGIVPEVITVGATDNTDSIVWFSSVGPVNQYSDYPYPPGLLKPDVVAPGENVNSTLPGGGYSGNTWSGTSMATPHVAGAAAVIRSKFPGLSHYRIKHGLKLTAVKLPTFALSPNNEYGYGRIDLFKALLYFSLMYPVEARVDYNRLMLPRAANAIREAKDLFDRARAKCDELKDGDFYEKCCVPYLDEAKILIERAEKFYAGGNYIAANNMALEAIVALNEILECCEG